jgi:hypothetical protein
MLTRQVPASRTLPFIYPIVGNQWTLAYAASFQKSVTVCMKATVNKTKSRKVTTILNTLTREMNTATTRMATQEHKFSTHCAFVIVHSIVLKDKILKDQQQCLMSLSFVLIEASYSPW